MGFVVWANGKYSGHNKRMGFLLLKIILHWFISVSLLLWGKQILLFLKQMYKEPSLGTEFVVIKKQIENESTYTLIGLLNTKALKKKVTGISKYLGKFLARWKWSRIIVISSQTSNGFPLVVRACSPFRDAYKLFCRSYTSWSWVSLLMKLLFQNFLFSYK